MMDSIFSLRPRSVGFAFLVVLLSGLWSGAGFASELWRWETVAATGSPTARHEASAVAFDGKLYLLGGRRINPTDVYDPKTNTWQQKAKPPFEIHHFQAVALGDKIYLLGAMTGQWPHEKPLDRVVAYIPAEDRFELLHEIPAERRRGGAGVVVYNQKIYIAGGITNGHMNGYVNWLDEYDPATRAVAGVAGCAAQAGSFCRRCCR